MNDNFTYNMFDLDEIDPIDYALLKNENFDWKSFYNLNLNQNTNEIHDNKDVPYIIHFIFGLMEQSEPFSFVHYIAILSAFTANPNVQTIFFHYHFPIYGEWWEKIQQKVPCLELRHIDVPTHIGSKQIKKTAHKADKARMDILWEMGGIYMDMDTISYESMEPFLKNDTTLCQQYNVGWTKLRDPIKYIGGICNAIMITKPSTKFFERWMNAYERAFDPDKWEEASIWLPMRLAKEYHEEVVLLKPEVFNVPGYWETKKMFEVPYFEVPISLVALHLCETKSIEHIKKITGWDWYNENKYTLYGKMMEPCIEKGLY